MRTRSASCCASGWGTTGGISRLQRDEVWEVERMKRLLDSLLAGYPVGALLLSRARSVSKVIDRDADDETVRDDA